MIPQLSFCSLHLKMPCIILNFLMYALQRKSCDHDVCTLVRKYYWVRKYSFCNALCPLVCHSFRSWSVLGCFLRFWFVSYPSGLWIWT